MRGGEIIIKIKCKIQPIFFFRFKANTVFKHINADKMYFLYMELSSKDMKFNKNVIKCLVFVFWFKICI